MVDLLIKNGIVFTMDDKNRVIRDGAVAVEGNRILDVGKTDEVAGKYKADETFDAKGRVVLPGFVNVHTHVPTPHKRGMSRLGWRLTGGIRAAYWELGESVTSEIIYGNSLVSCLELLNFGSTTIKDNYDMAENIAKAVAEVGLRGVISELVAEVDVTKIVDDVWEYNPDAARMKLNKSVQFMKDWDGREDGRITTVFSPQAPDMVRKEMLQEFLSVARKYGKLTTIHLCQSERELRQVRRLYGKSPVEHLKDIGMVGPDVLAAHCVYTNDVDTGILAKTDTRIMHCPVGQVRRGRTMAPVVDWLRSRIGFGIGTDNINHDMFTAMRMMLILINHQLGSDPYRASNLAYAPTPMEALELATIGGARILGMDDEIGSIEVGKKADIITVNMAKPHLMPVIDPAANLIWYANGNDVETVMVDGRILKDKDGVKSVDEEEALLNGKRVADRLMDKFFEINPDLKDSSYLL
jgi:5-methylthioadenosine/S-adenosylhomocysteine deaminase